ncbi:MarR family winged helix-turn-helix transcriptional regulator [Corynebacterium glyciniphilum]|uniref:MarR family winged helix-turn-helix transcriptional regulator n=1 Tax=Corynebacterium glyciniphilum TaxID=1404244 RepID=UPI0026EABAF2|nr:MarR family winged helix-turn-helix transcriptional regulator [Corynebacterium glyciniphilum]
MTCEAVHSLNLRGTSATVNAVAHETGIDQSGASRMIKNAAAAGYLTMSMSPADDRRREAVLTAEGRSMLDDARRWQEEIFHELTTGERGEKRSDAGPAK